MTAVRYVRAAGAKLKEVDDRLAVYVPATRGIHVLNPTGQLLVTYLEEPAAADELAAMLERATDGESATIRRDLAATLDSFLSAGVIERVE